MEETAIKIENVTKVFKLPHEKNSSVKSHVINFYRRNKGYDLQQALKDVSFEIKQGDFFGIVGRNGSGKSTLLKLLAGIYRPTEGAIHVNGTIVPFIELGVGFNPELTGRENVFLNGALLGFKRQEMHAMYDDIVNFAELRKFMDQKLKNYSSGMQVRLAFSIAIRAHGDILLLDEVLAVGDAAFQQKCFDYFEQLKREHKTVVFVSHDMIAVQRFCNRAAYIKDGVLKHVGTAGEVADIYMQENMEAEAPLKAPIGVKLSAEHKLSAKITEQSDDGVTVTAQYKTKDKKPVYVAMSVIKDGMTAAELTTPMEMKLAGGGKVSYTLDTSQLNSGIYEINLVLCRQDTRALVAICPDRLKFLIKGGDITRGGPLKLADTWTASK